MTMEQYDSVRRWLLDTRFFGKRSESTYNLYMVALSRFCEFVGKDPDQIIEERLEDLQSRDPRRMARYEELLMEWAKYLEDIGLTRGTVGTYCRAVKSFFKSNWVPLSVRTPKTWVTREDRRMTREDLAKMVEVGDLRGKVLVLFLSQSGMSISDFLSLRWADIYDELEAGVEPIHIHVVREKTMHKYDTFVGSATAEQLRKYVKKYSPKPSEPLLKICASTARNILSAMSKKAKIEPKIRPHTCRKFFSTQMKTAGCPNELVEYWVGHVLAYRGAYFIPSVEEQRKIYSEYEWAVSP